MMLPIPRVNSFLGFNLKNSLLLFQFLGIMIIFLGIIEYFKLTESFESIAILTTFNILPLLSAIACIYGIIKNKPKFMLPDLIGVILIICILIIIILLIPEIVIAYIKDTGKLATNDGVHVLRFWFFVWVFLCIMTAAFIYYVIALFSLYLCLTEGDSSVTRDTNFVLNMGQANFA